MTVAKAIADILERLGQNSDDASISERQVGCWLMAASCKLTAEYSRRFGFDNADTLSKLVECQAITTKKGDFYEAYVDLPYSVFQYGDVDGVQLVMRPGGNCIEPIGSMMEYKNQQYMTFGGSQEGYVRIGDRIYLTGGKYPEDLKLSLLILPDDIEAFEDSDAFPAPKELHYDILEAAEVIGNRQLGRPVDITNDGKHSNN